MGAPAVHRVFTVGRWPHGGDGGEGAVAVFRLQAILRQGVAQRLHPVPADGGEQLSDRQGRRLATRRHQAALGHREGVGDAAQGRAWVVEGQSDQFVPRGAAALSTAPVISPAICEPPKTGARGRVESPSVTRTRESGRPKTEAAVCARMV
jgi:hypothetical protein